MSSPSKNNIESMIRKYGHGLFKDTNRTKALVLDYFVAENTWQKKLIKLSIEQKIPTMLLHFQKNYGNRTGIKLLVTKFREANKLKEEEVEWIIKLWESALLTKKQSLKPKNIITNNDFLLINYDSSELTKTAQKTKHNLIIFPSLKNLLLGLLVSLMFVAIGFGMIFASDPMWLKKILINVVGYLGLLFFGLCSIIFLIKLMFPMPILVVDEKGFKMQSLGGNLKLKWDEILEIKIEEYMGHRMLAIYPLKPNILLNQSSWWYGLGLKLNSHIIAKSIAIRIAENLFGTSLEKTIEQIIALGPKNKTTI